MICTGQIASRKFSKPFLTVYIIYSKLRRSELLIVRLFNVRNDHPLAGSGAQPKVVMRNPRLDRECIISHRLVVEGRRLIFDNPYPTSTDIRPVRSFLNGHVSNNFEISVTLLQTNTCIC